MAQLIDVEDGRYRVQMNGKTPVAVMKGKANSKIRDVTNIKVGGDHPVKKRPDLKVMEKH